MKIKYFGHSCFMLEVMNKKLLFDPFISPNPLASHIDINSLMPDLILVSHGHEDHIYDVEQIAKNSNAQVIAVYEVATWFSKKGVENTIGLNTGGEITWENIKIKAMYAQHSSQMPDGAYGGNPIGFLIRTEEGNLYYSGDTAVCVDMQLIPQFCELDIAVLPIGNVYTMGVEDALMAADFCNADKVMGVHYDTFPVIKIDKNEVINTFKNEEIEMYLPNIGEEITI